MKKLLGPVIAVAVTVGVLWVAKELKGLGSIELGVFDEEDSDEEDDRAAERFEADVVGQTGVTFEEWLQSPEAKRYFGDAEEPLEVIQRLGDYADAVGGEPLTLADLEGIGVPDLTAIAEGFKQPSKD